MGRGEAMRQIRTGEQKSCTFCKKSQQAARWLIECPDKGTYISDECTVEPSRLKLPADEREAQLDDSPSLSSRVRIFLEEHLGSKRLRCSFCRKKLRSTTQLAGAIEVSQS